MTSNAEWNFAGQLIERLSPHSSLIDAADGNTIDSAELRRLILSYSAGLRSAGLRPGDRVLIGCALSPSSTFVYLGAIYAGLVAVPVDERSLVTSPETLIQAADAKAIWTEGGHRRALNCRQHLICLEGDLSRSATLLTPPAARSASDLAALMSTSGSTGVPQFVMVSHKNLVSNTEAIIRSQGLGGDEKAMLILPVSYVFGASILHTHLWQGGSVVFDRRFMFPDQVLKATASYECTTFAGVPTVFNILLRRSSIRRTEFPALRRFLQAGGKLTVERVQEMRDLFPKVKFYVMYGQTEATARISCMDPDRWDEKVGSVGKPLDNLTVAIVGDNGECVRRGEIGELLVKGPSVSCGYFNDPAKTQSVFSDGWLRTRDLARQDEEGYLWIEGRLGAFLKIRGARVSLAEVEARVMAIPGVFECGACAVDHEEAGEALMLLIVRENGSTLRPEDIRRHLPAQWTLDSVRLVPELPKTPAGKIARSALSILSKELHGTPE